MRNTEERVQAARLGARNIQRKRRQQVMMGGSALLSLCLIVLLAYAVPPLLTEHLSGTVTTGFSASVFVNSQFLSYIVIGILSFVLGVSVTILCMILRKKQREGDDHHDA